MIIKDHLDSTNAYLKRCVRSGYMSDFFAVLAHYQSEGRGQFGRHWQSLPGENLLFSVLFRPSSYGFILPQERFLMMSGLLETLIAILPALPKECVRIKWPNDLYVGRTKLGGMLLEIFSYEKTTYAVAGFGVNVNQTHFESMERTPTSLYLLTGNRHSIFPIASALEHALRHEFHRSETSGQQYQKRLLFTDDFFPLRINGKPYQAKLLRALEDGSIDLEIRDEQGNCSQINTPHHQQLCWDFPPLKP